jgi:hypothetical protein
MPGRMMPGRPHPEKRRHALTPSQSISSSQPSPSSPHSSRPRPTRHHSVRVDHPTPTSTELLNPIKVRSIMNKQQLLPSRIPRRKNHERVIHPSRAHSILNRAQSRNTLRMPSPRIMQSELVIPNNQQHASNLQVREQGTGRGPDGC